MQTEAAAKKIRPAAQGGLKNIVVTLHLEEQIFLVVLSSPGSFPQVLQ